MCELAFEKTFVLYNNHGYDAVLDQQLYCAVSLNMMMLIITLYATVTM